MVSGLEVVKKGKCFATHLEKKSHVLIPQPPRRGNVKKIVLQGNENIILFSLKGINNINPKKLRGLI